MDIDGARPVPEPNLALLGALQTCPRDAARDSRENSICNGDPGHARPPNEMTGRRLRACYCWPTVTRYDSIYRCKLDIQYPEWPPMTGEAGRAGSPTISAPLARARAAEFAYVPLKISSVYDSARRSRFLTAMPFEFLVPRMLASALFISLSPTPRTALARLRIAFSSFFPLAVLFALCWSWLTLGLLTTFVLQFYGVCRNSVSEKNIAKNSDPTD